MKKVVNEFKKFINRGNILDLSVAVIIGSAFTKIVNSFVSDITMPVISLFIGQEGFSNYKYIITPANDSLGIKENAIYYGAFIQNIVDFLIIAVIVFIMIKIINKISEISTETTDTLKEIIQERQKLERVMKNINDQITKSNK